MRPWGPQPLLVTGWVTGAALAAAAAEPVAWPEPTLVLETRHEIYEPAMAVDQSSGVNVAWAVHVDDHPPLQQIYMARWDGSSWSGPTAVVSAAAANAPSLAVDPYADIHLIWHSALARLQYTWTVAGSSTAETAWAPSVELAESNLRAQLRADPQGRLHLVYPGRGAAGPVYRSSRDGGATWTEAVEVAAPSAPNAAADYTRLAVSDNGTLHVVWTEFEFPKAWPPRGVFHSVSTDAGRSWSVPAQLAGPGFDQINVVTVDDRTVHVAWNGMVSIRGRYHRWSNDGGATWSPTEQIVASGGTEGPPQLLVDSARTLHLVTSYNSAAWHVVWDGARWSMPECISCGAAAASALIEEPSAVINDGNELHVVYWQARHQLWHTAARLTAPRLPPAPVQTAGWWSDRFRHRHSEQLAVALLGVVAGTVATLALRRQRVRRRLTERPRDRARPA